MEYIEFLVSGKVDGECSIEKLKTIIKNRFNVQIEMSSSKVLADYLYEEVNVDDSPELYEEIKSEFDFQLDNHHYKVNILRFTKYDVRYLKCRIETNEITNIEDICESEWFSFRTTLVELLYDQFGEIHWLSDSQNIKVSSDLYSKMHALENFLRSIIDEYMCIKHGKTWFEKYSYEDYVNKYLKFSEWFRKSRYELFKKIDNHLFNLEISDVFEVLKHAKKIVISKNVIKALEDIKKDKTNKDGMFNTDLLDEPSLWDEENMEEAFSNAVVNRWDNDFSKRRNMIAHNKMICLPMYMDTINQIVFFNESFVESKKVLLRRLKSDEDEIIRTAAREYDISLNMEYCGFDESLYDIDSVIDKLMDTEEIIELCGILEDDLESLKFCAEETFDSISTLYDGLTELNFFEDDEFIGEDMLRQYIYLLENNPIQNSLINLVKKSMSYDEYRIIEYELKGHLEMVQKNLLIVIHSFENVNIQRFTEGTIAEFIGFDGNSYELILYGEIFPERGTTNELRISIKENENEISEGYIFINYGDYEINDDGIPMPSAVEGITVNINDIIQKLSCIIDKEGKCIKRIAELAYNVEL